MKQTPTKVQKQWGYELWLANNEENDYCGKILHVDAGHKFSMHFHSEKHETFYILRGECRLRTVNTKTTVQKVTELKEGDCYVIERLTPHQVEAVSDCDIIESSTFHRDEDSYRVWRD